MMLFLYKLIIDAAANNPIMTSNRKNELQRTVEHFLLLHAADVAALLLIDLLAWMDEEMKPLALPLMELVLLCLCLLLLRRS